MALAFMRNSVEPVLASNLLLRMCAWFTRAKVVACTPKLDAQAEVRGNVTSLKLHSNAAAPSVAKAGGRTRAVVLPFPIHGEALLVKLADQLRRWTAGNAAQGSFDLALSRRKQTRLTVDAAAFVEFDATTALYHLVIELTEDTRLTLDSGDFDTIVRLLEQYVGDRLSGEPFEERAL